MGEARLTKLPVLSMLSGGGVIQYAGLFTIELRTQ